VLRVAIVGCGKIADAHASQIQRIRGSEIVGVCDKELLMARQLYERFPVGRYFGDLEELVRRATPDVVHITTPPASHFEIAKFCLEHGSHVYVEKPFTLCAPQAETLLALANDRGLKLTVGHDDQFSPAARRMRALVATGYLGGPPVHMESYFCYPLGDGPYVRALLGDKQHWVRLLPGMLIQNIISHGIARIAEFLSGGTVNIIACGFVSQSLKKLGETRMIDELRVIMSQEERTTAYFTFSSTMRPSLHQFRIYGATNGLILDRDHEVLIKLRGAALPSYAEKFISPLIMAHQQLDNLRVNVRSFLGRDFHMASGLKFLIEAFYKSIVDGTPVPIPYREILLTAHIMDGIIEQLKARSSEPRCCTQVQAVMPVT
jgi:predicted dehydrogenase